MSNLFAALAAGISWATPFSIIGSHGCGNTYPVGWNNDTATHTLRSGNYDRTYGVNIPNDYNSNKTRQWPLIIDYHGAQGTSFTQYQNSMYYNYTQGQEYVVVYPQGVNGTWQGPSYAIQDVNDIQFTTDLLAEIQSKYCIDTNRIYASGKSNGAGFLDTLACSDAGDKFAAFAMASAALYTDLTAFGCTKKRAILESHGDKDETIPYNPTSDGSGGPLPDIDSWVGWWGRRSCNLTAEPAVNDNKDGKDGGYNVTSYSCNNYADSIVHYQVFDLGHCWPSVTSLNYDALRNTSTEAHCQTQALDFTQVVLDFFAKWNLYNAPRNFGGIQGLFADT